MSQPLRDEDRIHAKNLGGHIAGTVGAGYFICYESARAGLESLITGKSFNDCMDEEKVDRVQNKCTDFGNKNTGVILKATWKLMTFGK